MQRKDGSRLWLFIGVIGLFLLSLQGVSAQSQPVFHIGVLDDQRGAISNGARLAVNEINAAGGVHGADGTTFTLDLLIVPSSAGSNLNQAVTTLKAANVIAVLGPETSDEILNGLPQIETLGVPIITPATDDTIITSDTSGLIFRSRASEALQGQALASYLIDEYKLTPVATIQLDVASTDSVIGFTTAASNLGVTPQPALMVNDTTKLDDSIATLVAANPAVIVAYGSPAMAASLYSGLQTQGWVGLFAYNQAFDPTFRLSVPYDQMSGVVAVMTWPFTATDPASMAFLNSYIQTYGELPGAVEAASYDSVKLIVDGLEKPGSLSDNLASAPETPGVQGVLKAQDLGTGELSNNVAIVRLGNLGAPEILARYQGNQRLPGVGPTAPITPPLATPTLFPTLTPTLFPTLVPLTATPQGVNLTIKQTLQNVRTGPGDNYDILGQLNQGEQAAVIGANLDDSWVVINFRGTQGWLAAYLVDITGDLRTVPVIPTPPTPTPGFTPSPTPSPATDLIIVSASISPNPITPNQNFTVNVTVGNIGGSPAGSFTVAGTFPPNNVALVGTVPGLGAGQSANVSMSGILTGTGTFTTSLLIDANNQVDEGVVGEQNNRYDITYTVGTPAVTVLRQGSQTLNLGDTLDLEGNGAQGDVNWNADGGTLGLKAIFGAKLGILGSSGDINAVTYDQISPSVTTRDSVAASEMAPGTLVGIVTADGHRGVMQVTAISATQIALNFKVYSA